MIPSLFIEPTCYCCSSTPAAPTNFTFPASGGVGGVSLGPTTQNIGGIPIWIWLLLIAATGVIVYLFMSRKKKEQ